jgi:DNA-binding MarR family transcriptional regulator
MKNHLQPLADFRHELRHFLRFSEEAATAAGLHPQQHQLLLQIAGADQAPTIGYLAARLDLRHHSVVELSKRCEEASLLLRTQGEDRRVVILSLTLKGKRLLDKLSSQHARELDVLAPRLILALRRIQKTTKRT